MDFITNTDNRNLLRRMRDGETLTTRQQVILTLRLSFPAIMAQISTILMEYIDASMVGRLGADNSAAIGLVASTTWLLGGLTGALATGFTVQVAHAIGAGQEEKARYLVRQGLAIALGFGLLLGLLAFAISPYLPIWLGGGETIRKAASDYFGIFAFYLPISQMNRMASGMLQCSGNMKTPGILHVMMCFLDVIFNAVLIFPSLTFGGITLQGFGLGVKGAALGTALAELTAGSLMLFALLVKSPALHLRSGEPLKFDKEQLVSALKIGVPVGFESTVLCGAQIVSTMIVAPLGTASIAANSFSVSAESLCYMPGYGIGTAATTLIGQSIGAGRQDLTKRLGWLTTFLGMAVMAVSGAVMYAAAPLMIGLLSPDAEIQALGTAVLRIEAFAEPMYAASIVANGVMRGAGDTLVPSILNLFSMWAVRLPLAAFLAPRMGLKGVWTAMCIELCVRGGLFLLRLWHGKWFRHKTV